MNIPPKTETAIKQDAHPTAVWSVQRAINSLGWGPLTEDGIYGQATAAAIRRYQSPRGLTPDGIAGPKTQARLARSVIAKADEDKTLPTNLLRSLCEGESGNFIAAVNWNVPGGVDCGYTQRRVTMPPTQTAISRAFDSVHQFKLARNRMLNLFGTFEGRPAVHSQERAWRVAVLSHNWPAGADRLSRTEEEDLSSYWTEPQKWVVNIGASFKDGYKVQTPLEWARFYSLGDSRHNHPGNAVKYVTDWTHICLQGM